MPSLFATLIIVLVVAPTPIFNMNCLTEFAGSRTAALGTTVFFARFFHHVTYFLHFDVNTQNAWLQAFANHLYKKKEVTFDFYF